MSFGWRVPHNTISLLITKVCQAIIDEYNYKDEVMRSPTTPEEWRAISNKLAERWNFPHTCGALDDKHVNCKCLPNSGSLYYNYKGFYIVVIMALVDADYKFIWADIGGMGSASDAQIDNASELKECVEAWSRMDSFLLLPLPPRPLPPRPRPPATGVFFIGFTDIEFPLLVSMLKTSGGVSRLFSTSI